ncbi:MAG: hypothetical protein GF317_00405 [Candidatus Lokiarchaeota archaeon]|nr:hypothetical protein [Candidatus Lokiarchaeota archaeon]MBD3198437.1 hypothetical protein [Candidatus Lokiarchaeota archaeon]
MKELKVGIIGSGFIAKHHARAYTLLPGIELVGISALHDTKPKKIMKELNIEFGYYKNYKDLLKKDLDAVSICLPNYLHKEVTIESLNTGSHVIIEKPLAMNAEEGFEMINAEKETNRNIFYAENNIFAPSFRKAKEIIEEGALGKIYRGRGKEQHSGPHSEWFYKKAKAGGGALIDLGIHDIACLVWFINAEVEKVFCQTSTMIPEREDFGTCEVEDNTVGILYFDNEAHVVIEESWTAPGGYDMGFELYGLKGQLNVSPTFSDLIKVYSKDGYGYAVEKAASTQGWTYPVPAESWSFGYPQEIKHFIECIRDNKTSNIDGSFGLKILQIVDTMYKSADSEKVEKVEYL